MSELAREKIDGHWEGVRRACTYQAVVEWATVWLAELWPHALALGFAPRGKGKYDERLLCTVPQIKVRYGMANEEAFGKWDGTDIYVADYKSMRKMQSRPSRDELRKTLLHEVQHALDELRGLTPRHNIWFARRLKKLEDAFDPRGD